MQTWEEKIIAREEGRKIGKAEGKILAIRKMMLKLNLTAGQAMDVLDIPVSDREKYAQEIQSRD